jgi:hypothetical protein
MPADCQSALQPTASRRYEEGPARSEPDWEMARVCWNASSDCYGLAETFGSRLAHVRDTTVILGTRWNASLPMARWNVSPPNARVIAFRGTKSALDFVTDGEVWRTDIGDGEVHHGFWDAWMSVQLQVLERAPWSPWPIYVTGHSLGGALAILAARNLVRAGISVAGVYTFGCPRVGNARFARSYDSLAATGSRAWRPSSAGRQWSADDGDNHAQGESEIPAAGFSQEVTERTEGTGRPLPDVGQLGDRTWRFVNEEDCVPRLPLWLTGYRHVGREVFAPSIGNGWRIAPRPGTWSWLAGKLISDCIGSYRDWKRGRAAQLVDHFCAAYGERVCSPQRHGGTEV